MNTAHWPWEAELPSHETGPTWEHDILPMLKSPPWLNGNKQNGDIDTEGVENHAAKIGSDWRNAMLKYGNPNRDGSNFDLHKYEDVKSSAVYIYQMCASRAMPITTDEGQYWPDDILKMFLVWINQGCRQRPSDVVVFRNPQMKPSNPVQSRTRKDIRDLTDLEIQTFRARIDDRLNPSELKSLWQQTGELHAFWCLHYQEASFPWHRCWLKLMETILDFPIPYWNCFATDTADPESPYAGFPQIFRDETYVHPSGATRKNPLKHALAYGGRNRSDTGRYITRNDILMNGRPSTPGKDLDAWNSQIKMVTKYHDNFVRAFNVPFFSQPQGLGIPWETLQIFEEDMPDHYYASQDSFDGWFEQAHDNFHGWIGGPHGDMSDNMFTAFDPIFLSFHCNMDRLFEHYLRTTPNLQFSARFPLRPFTRGAVSLNYDDPHTWAYTNIGEMVQDTLSLGYSYAPPACPDVFTFINPQQQQQQQQQSAGKKIPSPSGGIPMKLVSVSSVKELKAQTTNSTATPAAKTKKTPFIVFKDVCCTDDSYEIDVFLKDAASRVPDPVGNPDYVGRLFRMGMGRPHGGAEMKNKQRCRRDTVLRVIDAEHVADKIEEGFVQVVTRLRAAPDGRGPELVPEEEWKEMKGFVGELAWILG